MKKSYYYFSSLTIKVKKSIKIHKEKFYFLFWQEGNHPERLISNQFIDQKLNYIRNNPVEEMIVSEAEDYLFRSARDYAGVKGLLDVELMD